MRYSRVQLVDVYTLGLGCYNHVILVLKLGVDSVK